MEKPDVAEHLEHQNSEERKDVKESGAIDIYDEKANKKLNRRLDARILPLCCWVYLLNFLDRGTYLILPVHASIQSGQN